MTQWIADNPWLAMLMVGYLVVLGFIAWRYLKPPPGPPPSGMADVFNEPLNQGAA